MCENNLLYWATEKVTSKAVCKIKKLGIWSADIFWNYAFPQNSVLIFFVTNCLK